MSSQDLLDDAKAPAKVTTRSISSSQQSDPNVTETSSLLPTTIILNTDDASYGAIASVDANGQDTPKPSPRVYSNSYMARVVGCLLLGVFTSSTDTTLAMASHTVIASEFNRLSDSSWILISFLLAGAATQSMLTDQQYGKLSDIFGRKPVLLVNYGLFALGCGTSQSMGDVILGRALSGSGGSGMMSLASIIIMDLLPLRDVAAWQSYLNVIATIGRSLGGPVGGWLADTIGWRWSFLGQAPLFLVAMALISLIPKIPTMGPSQQESTADNKHQTRRKLARVDFIGAMFLSTGILALLFPLELGGNKVPWTHPLIPGLFSAAVLLLGLFAVTESRWVKEPIFPPRLLGEYNVLLAYSIMLCQFAAQISTMYTVPLYFKVTERVSNTEAGAHLFPAVLGNAVGSIMSGMLIKRYGRYKELAILAAALACTSYILLILRWEGHTNWIESFYVLPGGMCMGIMQNSVFIALQASIDPVDKAVAASGHFLMTPIGSILGMAASTAAITAALHDNFHSRLLGLGVNEEDARKIIAQAVASVNYVDKAPTEQIRKALVLSYVKGLRRSHFISLGWSLTALLGGLLLEGNKLNR